MSTNEQQTLTDQHVKNTIEKVIGELIINNGSEMDDIQSTRDECLKAGEVTGEAKKHKDGSYQTVGNGVQQDSAKYYRDCKTRTRDIELGHGIWFWRNARCGERRQIFLSGTEYFVGTGYEGNRLGDKVSGNLSNIMRTR